MDTIEGVLRGIDGGRVLDVATQQGGFAQSLMENLRGYSEIVGVDINEQAIQAAREALGQEHVRFLVMDAERLDLEDESFDTVSISASLHHLQNVPQVLEEMKRVLKPNGHFIIVEMHREGKTEAEWTSIHLHHWAARVDTALGRPHNSTLTRQELEGHVASLGLRDVEFHDYTDRDSDPMEGARIELLEGAIESIMQRAEGVRNSRELQGQGEKLRRRLHEAGAQGEPIVMIAGRK